MAARLAAAAITTSALDQLDAVLREHEAIDPHDFSRHIELDAQFHRLIRDAAASPVLLRMLEEIQGQVIVAMRSTNVTVGVRGATSDHRAIFDALARRDPEASERAARAHISRLTGILRDPDGTGS